MSLVPWGRRSVVAAPPDGAIVARPRPRRMRPRSYRAGRCLRLAVLGLSGSLLGGRLLGLDAFARPRPKTWRPPELKVAPPPPVTDPGPLLDRALGYLGHPYTFGGVGSPGFDCSGFVCRVYAESGWAIPRVSRDQARAGSEVPLHDLRPGDLLLFADRGRPISHVGLYLGEGTLVHASSGRGEVALADLSSRWFRNRLVAARRILTTEPSFHAPEAVVEELIEHRGATALSPFVDRPSAFSDPALGFRLGPPEGTSVGLRAAAASEAERIGAVLVPEASFLHPPWALEVTAAVPIRFEPGGRPTVGPVESFGDATKFLRRARLGLPGARAELALERVGSYRLGSGTLVHDLSPALTAGGVPGLSVARSPLTLFAAVRPREGAAEVLLDDVVAPRLAGIGGTLGLAPWLLAGGAAAVDFGGIDPQESVRGADHLSGASIGLNVPLISKERASLGLSVDGQAIGTGWRERASTVVGLGAEAVLGARLGFGGRRRTVVGLDLGGGLAGPDFVLGLFGPAYFAGREGHLAALEAADTTRGVVSARAHLRRGTLAIRLGYGQGVGGPAIAFDRRLEALVELAGLSLGGPRALDLRAAYAARAPFTPDAAVHAFAGGARVRLASWLSAEVLAQLGETFSAAGGLTVTWVP